jgi:phosphoenolpyruvate carboxylase
VFSAVLPKTTETAALLQSRLVLAEYVRRARACQDMLTHSVLICKVNQELLDSIARDKKEMSKIPALNHDIELYAHEPYRLKLRMIRHRLEQNLRIVNKRLKQVGLNDEVTTCFGF